MVARIFQGEELLIATHNKGKAAEIAELLKPYVRRFMTSADLTLPEPEETGTTFAENAILKALSASRESGKVALADDSGLSVVALGGDPGIYSARWAGPQKDFGLAMQKVQDALKDQTDKRASFVCVLALAWSDGHTETFEGRIDGTLVWPPRGQKGFGYDPMFVPEGKTQSFAEMHMTEKQDISHRSRAFAKLVAGCFQGKA